MNIHIVKGKNPVIRMIRMIKTTMIFARVNAFILLHYDIQVDDKGREGNVGVSQAV